MTLKKLSLGLLTAITLVTLAACDVDDDDQVVSTTTSTAASSTTATSASTPAATLSQDEAKAIALKDAGLAETEVTLLVIEQDIDNGVATYDIDFVKDTTEYSYTINANTGDVLEKSTEVVD